MSSPNQTTSLLQRSSADLTPNSNLKQKALQITRNPFNIPLPSSQTQNPSTPTDENLNLQSALRRLRQEAKQARKSL